jgi:hypothetical protein
MTRDGKTIPVECPYLPTINTKKTKKTKQKTKTKKTIWNRNDKSIRKKTATCWHKRENNELADKSRLPVSDTYPWQSRLLRPPPNIRRSFSSSTVMSHMLLQGDFFLTSRCLPPQRRTKSPETECTRQVEGKKLRLLERFCPLGKSEKTKLRNFL